MKWRTLICSLTHNKGVIFKLTVLFSNNGSLWSGEIDLQVLNLSVSYPGVPCIYVTEGFDFVRGCFEISHKAMTRPFVRFVTWGIEKTRLEFKVFLIKMISLFSIRMTRPVHFDHKVYLFNPYRRKWQAQWFKTIPHMVK